MVGRRCANVACLLGFIGVYLSFRKDINEKINVLWLQTINKEIIVKYYGRSRKIRIIMDVYSAMAVYCHQHLDES